MTPAPPQPTTPLATRVPWYRRLPSTRRFIVWNLFWWVAGAAALVGGTFYTQHVVKPISEAGGSVIETINPGEIVRKENSSKRVFGNSDRMNILVLGIDYNYNNQGILYTKGARSDTMIVMSLSREADFFNIVSIPRDTSVLIAEDIGYDKINSAYSYGGVEQAKETVSDFLDIPIHHHVIVKVKSAKDVVDALGGLPINVEKDMDYDDNWGKLHIHLKKGPQVLNGEQAVGYARFRMDAEGDRGRIRRQQQVVRALGRKLKEPAILTRVKELAEVVQENVETDLQLMDMMDLANLYSEFDFSKMRSAAIVGDDAVDNNGISYIVPYAPENDRTVRRLLKSLDWLSKDDLRIRVYFKHAPASLAYNLADRLYAAGFVGVQVEAMEFEDPHDTKETHIVWYNSLPRLKGVLYAVLGQKPEREGVVPEGRDDDLAIYVGDTEEGNWKEVPKHLLDQNAGQNDDRPEERFSPDFRPRALPPSNTSIEEGYSPGVDPNAEDVTEINYPRAGEEVQVETAPVELPPPPEPVIEAEPEPEPLPEPPINIEEELPPLPEPVEIEEAPPVPVEVELESAAPMPVATPVAAWDVR